MSGNDYDYSNLGSIPLTPQQNYYQPLALNVDPAMLEGSKYLFEGDETKTRSISETMFFGIGSSYMLGGVAGGLWGAKEHFATFGGGSKQVRWTHALNCLTKKGPFVGNSMAVLALLYTASGGIMGKVRNKEDIWNNVVGGAFTGALFKSTGGKKMLLGATAAGALFGLSLNMLIGVMSEGVSYVPETLKDAFSRDDES